jgi:hypothetical protein
MHLSASHGLADAAKVLLVALQSAQLCLDRLRRYEASRWRQAGQTSIAFDVNPGANDYDR